MDVRAGNSFYANSQTEVWGENKNESKTNEKTN
jgi:hypothetical protein